MPFLFLIFLFDARATSGGVLVTYKKKNSRVPSSQITEQADEDLTYNISSRHHKGQKHSFPTTAEFPTKAKIEDHQFLKEGEKICTNFRANERLL